MPTRASRPTAAQRRLPGHGHAYADTPYAYTPPHAHGHGSMPMPGHGPGHGPMPPGTARLWPLPADVPADVPADTPADTPANVPADTHEGGLPLSGSGRHRSTYPSRMHPSRSAIGSSHPHTALRIQIHPHGHRHSTQRQQPGYYSPPLGLSGVASGCASACGMTPQMRSMRPERPHSAPSTRYARSQMRPHSAPSSSVTSPPISPLSSSSPRGRVRMVTSPRSSPRQPPWECGPSCLDAVTVFSFPAPWTAAMSSGGYCGSPVAGMQGSCRGVQHP